MQSLTTVGLLAAWERGQAKPYALERGLSLVQAAYPETSLSMLAQLSIGERDTLLLAIREKLFGQGLSAVVSCPNCGEKLELEASTADLYRDRVVPDDSLMCMTFKDYKLEFRLPNSLDLIAIRKIEGLEGKRKELINLLISRASNRGASIASSDLPEELIAALERKMEELDPQAVVRLKIVCDSCQHQWDEEFEVASFLWGEVDAWAGRLLREVHVLARAYAWREEDILAMSSRRRHCYLEMLGE